MKTKVLLIYNKVWPYRIKIFELLNEKIDLTVAYSDPSFLDKKYSFKTVYLPVKAVGPFEFHRNNLFNICSKYDVIVGLFNVRWISVMLLCLNPFRKYSISYWGIGVRASYENKFDSDSRWDKLRFFFAKRAESLIFYSSYPIKKYIQGGINKDKLFIANNTTEVDYTGEIDYVRKRNFLFVGTLYAQKGIDVLLAAYLKLSKFKDNYPCLEIIGDGPEAPKIREFINSNNLHDKIVMHGSIYNPQKLSEIYKNAIACISPNQAGLSVLTTMGNGTIFVTEKEAITGGEIFSITDKKNGIIYEGGEDELLVKLRWIVENRSETVEMCKNALDFYTESRTPGQMADSIYQAILFSKNSFS
ncbi:glycosyltransferase [Pedobacter sp.]|jgi:glycosyltransferase involved in cell wall biosynthesis|uniref:glycosyltransferase n=1 Tax=Pedobacter sp. TaxID=1411316 RepID=UPI002C12C7E2|nr:glycosyltransferase [Pedobacter sp.]HWW42661.1 glycosyltransferase [Pedobacter sp.]